MEFFIKLGPEPLSSQLPVPAFGCEAFTLGSFLPAAYWLHADWAAFGSGGAVSPARPSGADIGHRAAAPVPVSSATSQILSEGIACVDRHSSCASASRLHPCLRQSVTQLLVDYQQALTQFRAGVEMLSVRELLDRESAAAPGQRPWNASACCITMEPAWPAVVTPVKELLRKLHEASSQLE